MLPLGNLCLESGPVRRPVGGCGRVLVFVQSPKLKPVLEPRAARALEGPTRVFHEVLVVSGVRAVVGVPVSSFPLWGRYQLVRGVGHEVLVRRTLPDFLTVHVLVHQVERVMLKKRCPFLVARFHRGKKVVILEGDNVQWHHERATESSCSVSSCPVCCVGPNHCARCLETPSSLLGRIVLVGGGAPAIVTFH